jgi:hypothetical protein
MLCPRRKAATRKEKNSGTPFRGKLINHKMEKVPYLKELPYVDVDSLDNAHALARRREELSEEDISVLAPALFRQDAETFLRENYCAFAKIWREISHDPSDVPRRRGRS